MLNLETCKLEQLASPEKAAMATGPFGSAVSSKHFVQDGVPMLRGSNLSDDVGTRLIETDLVFLEPELADTFARSTARPGDLVFTCWGSVGQIGYIDEHSGHDGFIVSNKQMKFTPDKAKVDPLFLYYYLSQPAMVDLVKSQAIGSTIPGFNLGQLRALPVSIPSFSAQRAIAEVLGALDDKIAVNTKLTTLLTLNLEASFLSIVGRQSGFIPFTDLATVTRGVSYRSVDLLESTTALVTLKSFDRNGGYASRGLKNYTGPYKPAQRIYPGEIVVAQTDLTQAAEVVGRAIRVPASANHGVLVASLDLAIVRPVPEIPVEFLLGLMLQGRFREHCRSRTSGTTVLHLASDAIPTFMAPDVSSKLQQEYATVARPMLEMRDSLSIESESLAATRDALLPQLMSGKLRVRDGEENLEVAR